MEKENKHEKDPTRKMEELTMDLLKEPNSKYPLMMQGKNDWTSDAQADKPVTIFFFFFFGRQTYNTYMIERN